MLEDSESVQKFLPFPLTTTCPVLVDLFFMIFILFNLGFAGSVKVAFVDPPVNKYMDVELLASLFVENTPPRRAKESMSALSPSAIPYLLIDIWSRTLSFWGSLLVI